LSQIPKETASSGKLASFLFIGPRFGAFLGLLGASLHGSAAVLQCYSAESACCCGSALLQDKLAGCGLVWFGGPTPRHSHTLKPAGLEARWK